MKGLFTAIILLSTLSYSAQPIWSSSNEPSVNDSVYYYQLDSNVTNYSSIKGAGVAWDYSAVSTYSFDALKKAKATDATQGPYVNFYPSAVHDDYIENHLHNFNSLTATERTSYGFQVTDPTEGDILITYNGFTDRSYPWSYLSQDSTTLVNCKIVMYPNSSNPPQFKANAGGIYSSTVDAYGSLTIGDTVLTDVLRNSIEDSIQANLVIAGKATLILSQYEYYVSGISFPVFIHSHVKIYGAIINTEYSTVLSLIKPKISTGIANSSEENPVFNVLPNPSSDFFTINTDASVTINEITIYDMSGRIQYFTSTREIDSPSIDISEFTDGMYVIKVRSQKGEYFTKRLVKSSR
jgi:hypothetical protein